jgi:hypothetical protein
MTDKLLNLQLVLLSLLDDPAATDVKPEEVETAWKKEAIIALLRGRFSTHPVFKGFDGGMKFDQLEGPLSGHLAVFMPESTKYELRHSGLCLIAGAISYALLQPTKSKSSDK